MIDTICAIDNLDASLGDFFTSCRLDIEDYFEGNGLPIFFIQSNTLNDLNVNLRVEALIKFVFIAYSHGTKTELVQNGLAYLNEHNVARFNNSFFYTCSCHTASGLGLNLIENGCISYIGYRDKFIVWDYNRDPFVECANLGIKLFFEGHYMNQIIEAMINKYNEHIDNYTNDVFGAAMLVANRKSLTPLGQNISIREVIENY